MVRKSKAAANHASGMSHERRGIVGKKIWITGAANGIGLAIAKGLISARCGGLAIVDVLDQATGEALSRRLTTAETAVMYYKCDVRDASGLEASLGAAMRALSGIDIVVNNAGIVDEDSVSRTVSVNLLGVVHGTEAAVRLGVGQVVNMGSAAGVFGLGEGAYYAASKHGVVGYTRSIGERLKERVRICCVCPGFVDCGIGVGRDWGEGKVGVMKVGRLVEFFLGVVEEGIGGGRVVYVSETLGGREVRTDVGRRVEVRARL